jgi:RNase P subunit RPR2
MAKGKGSGGGGGVQNKAIYSRISFLQQAAVTLSSIHLEALDSGVSASSTEFSKSSQHGAMSEGPTLAKSPLQGMSRRLATDLRAVSLKTRIRLKPEVKRTICKYCDSVLIDGETCTAIIENKSKGGKKPWADILVRKCNTCGGEKRYPVSAPRTKRKTERGVGAVDGPSTSIGR